LLQAAPSADEKIEACGLAIALFFIVSCQYTRRGGPIQFAANYCQLRPNAVISENKFLNSEGCGRGYLATSQLCARLAGTHDYRRAGGARSRRILQPRPCAQAGLL
jgi:hypothetical protein